MPYRYWLKSDTIVGYTFDTEVVCEDCTRDIAQAEVARLGSATCWGDSGSAEDILGEWASLIGLDRKDEASYDSSEFPKVIFADQAQAGERCGRCYELLIGGEL